MTARPLAIPTDPLGALRAASSLPGVCLLHSGMQAYGLGRYSILAACPWKALSYRNGIAYVEEGDRRETRECNPLDAFEQELGEPGSAQPQDMPFAGGAIGYFSYDLGPAIQTCWEDGAEASGCLMRFGYYGGAVVFDHVEDRVFVAMMPGLSNAQRAGVERLVQAVQNARPAASEPFRLRSALQSNFSRADYLAAVARAREYIRVGEVYQVNLSQRFSGAFTGSPLDLFLRLAELNPAPYAAYMDFEDEQILSSSPERFLQLEKGRAETRPIKGTRPVGTSEVETAAYARSLAESEKDRAELLMIVDLERNDLGRVCEPGSIVVEELFALERYATVLHQTARVSGKLELGRGVVDCMKAMFPGGSITGAPKIRAMQVIDELERGRRGIYTGSIGYVDASGTADFNIAIRTIRTADDGVSFQVGGGVVWESDPESEYEETLVKARAMIEAIGANA